MYNLRGFICNLIHKRRFERPHYSASKHGGEFDSESVAGLLVSEILSPAGARDEAEDAESADLYTQMRPCLWILAAIEIWPLHQKNGRVRFRKWSLPFVYAVVATLATMWIAARGLLHWTRVMNSAGYFSLKTYWAFFIIIGHIYLVIPLIHWHGLRQVAEAFNYTHRFQANCRRVLGVPLRLGVARRSTIMGLLSPVVGVALTTWSHDAGYVPWDQFPIFEMASTYLTIVPETWQILTLALENAAIQLHRQLARILVPRVGPRGGGTAEGRDNLHGVRASADSWFTPRRLVVDGGVAVVGEGTGTSLSTAFRDSDENAGRDVGYRNGLDLLEGARASRRAYGRTGGLCVAKATTRTTVGDSRREETGRGGQSGRRGLGAKIVIAGVDGGEHEGGLDGAEVARQLRELRWLWLQLMHSTRLWSAAWSLSLAHLLLFSMSAVLLSVFGIAIPLLRGQILDDRLAGMAVAIVQNMRNINAVCSTGNRLRRQVNITFYKVMLHAPLSATETTIRSEVQKFLKVIELQDPSISLGGYVTLDRTLAIGCVTLLLTYVVVLMQFAYAKGAR